MEYNTEKGNGDVRTVINRGEVRGRRLTRQLEGIQGALVFACLLNPADYPTVMFLSRPRHDTPRSGSAA